MAQHEDSGAEWEVPLGLGEEDRQQLRRIIGAFPKLKFAAGYGSGVVPQADATNLTKVRPSIRWLDTIILFCCPLLSLIIHRAHRSR